ncbi:M48 family metalloprotease [Streptomyces platensis]|uniref:M48 family metalloprotease n=1 Tax=Streptomyces platensis TaxID=58346 RepID=UPI002E252EF4|nr:M48 family metalloprotease [Streptomyces platensis]
MNFAVWLPLLIPLLAVPVARHATERLTPRTAAWTLGACSALLGMCSTGTLGLLAVRGALQITPVAALEDISPRLLDDRTQLTLPIGILATGLLAATTVTATAVAVRSWRELRAARQAAGTVSGELAVHPDERPYAYALPGPFGRRGRIVVSTAMLRALNADEREVLFAHERAHLAGRHHLFLSCAHLAATLHPMLRGLRAPLTYALERWADEAAAEAVADRQLAGRAIGRAALAAVTPAGRPRLLPGVTCGPVPRRVAALMDPDPTRTTQSPGRRDSHRRLVAALLVSCLALSAASMLHAANELHSSVEIAESRTDIR